MRATTTARSGVGSRTDACDTAQYCLTVEKNTPFHQARAAGRLTLPSDDRCADLYRTCVERAAQRGLERYEVSNFARGRNAQARHNVNFWQGGQVSDCSE